MVKDDCEEFEEEYINFGEPAWLYTNWIDYRNNLFYKKAHKI